MDNGEPESDYLKDMLKMREEFKGLPQQKKELIKNTIELTDSGREEKAKEWLEVEGIEATEHRIKSLSEMLDAVESIDIFGKGCYIEIESPIGDDKVYARRLLSQIEYGKSFVYLRKNMKFVPGWGY